MRENCLYGGNGGLSAGDRWLLFSNRHRGTFNECNTKSYLTYIYSAGYN